LLRSRFVRVSDEALKHLAPDLAAALDAGRPALPDADAEDRRECSWRDAVSRRGGRWSIACRRRSSSIVCWPSRPTRASWPGPGLAQARENLKKIRGLMRRIQNRGYATLERLVEHFSQLVAGGDESNAIIDAVDAVNLMTVHAAKGLEFPVVFVVNLGRGSGGGRDPIRIHARPGPEGDEGSNRSVGIGEHRNEIDDDAEAREAEETKRLLYVALTRARDRLYLCGTLADDGRLIMARGSLGRLLPPLQLAMHGHGGAHDGDHGGAHGGADTTTVTTGVRRWPRRCGRRCARGCDGDHEGAHEGAAVGPTATHVLTVVAPPGEAATSWTAVAAEAPEREPGFAPLEADGVSRVAATVESEMPGTGRPAAVSTTSLGTLVHRLLAHARHRDERDPRVLARVARQLADRVDTTDAGDDLVERAVTLCLGVLSRPELTELPEGTRLVFEAAYSRRRPDGRVERGAIDGWWCRPTR
jgi:ATP-dependent exoDNAse (exonuclease V) beta subunit